MQETIVYTNQVPGIGFAQELKPVQKTMEKILILPMPEW